MIGIVNHDFGRVLIYCNKNFAQYLDSTQKSNYHYAQ